MKKSLVLLLSALFIIILAGCGGGNDEEKSDSESGQAEEKETIQFGATVGPYSDMVTKAIAPILEDKGYKVENTEFTDYVQPNKSLGNGDLDANLFQHKIYMEAFAEENGLDLSEVIIVPTAPMGLYSKTYEAIEDIEDGATITIANDPTNLARTLVMLETEGLITISKDVDPLKASVKDVTDNPKNIDFQEIEAAQLPRMVESEDASAVPGNYALAAGMNLLDALALENMPDDYRNRVVVRTEDLDKQWVKDIKAAVESEEFEKTIDEQFQGFGKPEWMKNR
ncbi:MetQ/NlpA family ABC transporter substrate-binding protein [Aquibacillus salsiterrae]|uniref:Lipoprotein n=1 Tax=Aquibacillus salsiterrae TaxID=2950439 RepID=A0A9X3WAV1_9BACI|nr:MetQ/NlpA family ABC transporter substrate-binding protein [Aquibacillus salsiterrae]MDC3415967.1 MetQ/NlpA family ABC transporter substrate-binding protein [Aquibacillus salsiterrae]